MLCSHCLGLVFTAHQHSFLCMQSAVLAMTVRLSVTRWYHAKTTQATIMGSSLEDSPMTLVSSRLTTPRNSKENIGSGGADEKGVGKIGNFQPVGRRISETDRTIVKMRRKSHTRFRLVPKSSTLDDPERTVHNLLQKRCVFWSPLHKFE